MSTRVIRYRTKPDRSEENQRLVEDVFAELAEQRPGGLRYATLRLDDGVSFIHVVTVEDGTGPGPLADLQAFGRFQAGIADRCDEQPVVIDAHVVGSYGFGIGG